MTARSSREAEQAGPRIAALRPRRDGTAFDEAEAELEHRVGHLAVLVETGREPHRIGKEEAKGPDGERGIAVRRARQERGGHPRQAERRAVGGLGRQPPQQGCPGVHQHGLAIPSIPRPVYRDRARAGLPRLRACPGADRPVRIFSETRTTFLDVMLTHSQIWHAIDALADHHGLSPSGLAKLAGLDPTTFNKSKRAAGGKLRWPSTESVAKALEAVGATLRRVCRVDGTAKRGRARAGAHDPADRPGPGRQPAAISTMRASPAARAGRRSASPSFPTRTPMRSRSPATPWCRFIATATASWSRRRRACAAATAWWPRPAPAR